MRLWCGTQAWVSHVDAENQAVGEKIAATLEDDWGIADVDCMPSMYLHDIQQLIVEAGGSGKWALAVEHRLPQPFKRMPSSAPPASAHLAHTSTGPKDGVSPAGDSSGEQAGSGGEQAGSTFGKSRSFKIGDKFARDGAAALP